MVVRKIAEALLTQAALDLFGTQLNGKPLLTNRTDRVITTHIPAVPGRRFICAPDTPLLILQRNPKEAQFGREASYEGSAGRSLLHTPYSL
jgi:hypothetical protein